MVLYMPHIHVFARIQAASFLTQQLKEVVFVQKAELSQHTLILLQDVSGLMGYLVCASRCP